MNFRNQSYVSKKAMPFVCRGMPFCVATRGALHNVRRTVSIESGLVTFPDIWQLGMHFFALQGVCHCGLRVAFIASD